MSVEKLQEQLAAIKTSEDMFSGELVKASKEMNRIICEALAKARGEGNTNQFASLLAEYRKIWYNKPALQRLEANLRDANLFKASLFGADLCLANLHLADLRNADLRLANLRLADLSGANLSGANLSGGANLRDVNLLNANLRNVDLRFANLSGANLSGANLSGAKLRFADLSGANLSGANLSGAKLYLANLSGADLRLAITIGADFGSVRGGFEYMARGELQAKLANAIKTPDELVKVIQGFLEGSNKDSITKEDLDTLPSLYRAALDIGNNGTKKREDESVICQPGEEICQKLLTFARLLNEKFPVLTATPFSRLHVKMHDVLAGRGGEVSNFMAAVTFLRGIYADKKDSSLSEGVKGLALSIGVKIVSTLLSNGGEAEYLTIQMAGQLCAQASKKEFSTKEAIKLKHVLSLTEQALPPVKAILTLEARIIEAVSAAKDGEVVIIKTTVDGKIHSDDMVKEALREASGKQILSDAVELNHIQTTDNHIQITMPKDMVDAICPSKKKEEKTSASPIARRPSPALEIKVMDAPLLSGVATEIQRG